MVMKFGGTSVGSTERIGNVAKRVSAYVKRTGDKVVVVVSAMSGETDRLLELSRKVTLRGPSDREAHQLLAAGEQVTSALTAMALEREGQESQSMLAFQLPIRTIERYGLHLIEKIEVKKLKALLNQGIIPVVAGFQGIDPDGAYTTLGRGGSDTTAVALAAALDRARCYIYTDVDGVYTALPSICRTAKKLKSLSYEEMLEMASSGAKVLQSRSVSLAKKYQVPLIVASSFSEEEGTEIVEEYPGMEDAVVSGITCKTDQAKLTLRNLPDIPGIAAKVFTAIAEGGVVVDMIIQSQSIAGNASISFTVDRVDAEKSYEILQILTRASMPDSSIEVDKDIAKLSVVGEGMRTHAGVASEIFRVLGEEKINIEMITTSEIKTSLAIRQKYAELAVRCLHERFIEGKGKP